MQILRLLAARRAASSINESPVSERRDDEGDFFDLDFSSSSVRASSSSSSGSLSFSDSDDDCTELDFIISLQRRSSASPLKFCASEPLSRADSLQSPQHGAGKRGIGSLRTMSFGARKAPPLYRGGRHSLASTSSGRRSFAGSSSSSGGSLFVDSPPRATGHDEHHAAEQRCRRAPSGDVIRRCLAKISRRLRTVVSPRAADARRLRRLRKCRSASSAPPNSVPARRDDDSAAEKQDDIAGAIAHCKDSLDRGMHSRSSSAPRRWCVRVQE